MSVGDELYVPIEVGAGRITKFIVKAGKERLPRTGGGGALTVHPVAAAGTAAVQRSGPEHGGQSAAERNARQPRWGNGYGENASIPPGDPRTTQFPPTGNAPFVPRNVGFEQTPNAGDGLNRGYEPYRNPPAADLSNYPPYTAPATTQPQFPASHRLVRTIPMRRTAALPPPPSTFSPNPTGFTNTGVLPANQDRPWGPLLFVTFALFFSIGGNLYLAYTALEFHSRYRNAIERLRRRHGADDH